jgi:hypothetical protein
MTTGLKLYFITGDHLDGIEPNIDWFVSARSPEEAVELYIAYVRKYMSLDEDTADAEFFEAVHVREVPRVGMMATVIEWQEPILTRKF